MKELNIDKNESQQRLDRFLKKYLKEASHGFIQKMIRKKNITLNGKKAKADTIIVEGDIIRLYLADDTIEKFRGEDQVIKKNTFTPDVIYEDSNIILMNKPVGVLSHSASENCTNNIVDGMINYLYSKGEYDPKLEKTFIPAICNRLDRNTSGIIIGAKNYQSLKLINSSIKKGNINRYYKTIVKGVFKKDQTIEGYLTKNSELNKVRVSNEEVGDSKKISTKIKPLTFTDRYSLLEIQLITGRTHQIRAHLSSIGYPIIGDSKYGDRKTNEYFRRKFSLNNQFLHGYKIIFNDMDKTLEYLNQREFIAYPNEIYNKIEKNLFKN